MVLRSNQIAALCLMCWGTIAFAQREPVSSEGAQGETAQASAEVIEIWDERPEKPYDRDTIVRLTGEQLALRGATDLATALALLPDVKVFDAGRGGVHVEIRGARRGVRIMVDGVLVNDPYYGLFDVTSIPITDIEQIRVSTAPASPIDGPGGPGGVIEIHTRDASGKAGGIMRLVLDSLPTIGASATGRTYLTNAWALRLSASGLVSDHAFDTADGESIDEDRQSVSAAARIEHKRYHAAGLRRLAFDLAYDGRGYLAPPSDELITALFLRVDHQRSLRLGARMDDSYGKTQLQIRSWLQALDRASGNFRDAALTDLANDEDLAAVRAGANVLVTRPWKRASLARHARWVASATLDHEQATVTTTIANTATTVDGQATVAGGAVGAQYQKAAWALDASIGAGVPFNADVAPWPEAKVSATWKAAAHGSLQAIGARKGRIPTLRERYQSQSGNIALAPEQATHLELIAAWTSSRFELSAAPYARFTTGTVKVGEDNLLENIGDLRILGADMRAALRVCEGCEIGGGYQWAKAHSNDAGDDPIDRFPEHRAEGWASLARWEVAATVRGRYYGRSIDRTETVGAYVLWEASASWTVSPHWLITARLDDVLDARPETRNGYLAQGRTATFVVQYSPWH